MGALQALDQDDAGRVRAAYGPNYERLVELKRRYDPDKHLPPESEHRSLTLEAGGMSVTLGDLSLLLGCARSGRRRSALSSRCMTPFGQARAVALARRVRQPLRPLLDHCVPSVCLDGHFESRRVVAVLGDRRLDDVLEQLGVERLEVRPAIRPNHRELVAVVRAHATRLVDIGGVPLETGL
jgi:hypothetical protein